MHVLGANMTICHRCRFTTVDILHAAHAHNCHIDISADPQNYQLVISVEADVSRASDDFNFNLV